jgi:hypothetical protein
VEEEEVKSLTPRPAHVKVFNKLVQLAPPFEVRIPARNCKLSPGDVVYVREPWRIHVYGWSTCIDYAYGGSMNLGGGPQVERATAWSKRHGAFLDFEGARADLHNPEWLPAARMPAWASRFRLTLVGEPAPWSRFLLEHIRHT